MREVNRMSKRVMRLNAGVRLAVTAAPAALLALGATAITGTVLAAGAAGPAIQGRITGWDKLVPKVYAEAASDPHRYRIREASGAGTPESRRPTANVSRDLCVAAFGAVAGAHEPVAVKVTGGRVTPSTIVVSPGTRVNFENVDPFPHALFEKGDDKWGASPMGPGSTRAWTATSAGLHQIRDEMFPSVSMYVVVDPGAVEFALPDRDGNFSLVAPPGDYSFKVFFEGKPVGRSIDGLHLRDKGFQMTETISVSGGDSK
jgi:plastocyanin